MTATQTFALTLPLIVIGADVGPGAYDAVPDPVIEAALNKRRHKGGLSSMDCAIPREKMIRQSLGIVNAGNEPCPGDYVIEKGLGSFGELKGYRLIWYYLTKHVKRFAH